MDETIEAGRETDERIAEVLGAKHVGDMPNSPFGSGTWLHPKPVDALLRDHYEWTSEGYGPVLPFSTDWNCAMWAAELFGDPWDCCLRREPAWKPPAERHWEIAVRNDSGIIEEGEYNPGVSAPTGPLCICRAILELYSRSS